MSHESLPPAPFGRVESRIYAVLFAGLAIFPLALVAALEYRAFRPGTGSLSRGTTGSDVIAFGFLFAVSMFMGRNAFTVFHHRRHSRTFKLLPWLQAAIILYMVALRRHWL